MKILTTAEDYIKSLEEEFGFDTKTLLEITEIQTKKTLLEMIKIEMKMNEAIDKYQESKLHVIKK